MVNKKPQIIFLGTPEFAIPALENLLQADLTPVLVVTQPDKPIGRHQQLAPTPVKELALANNLKIAQPRNKKELKLLFKKYQPDICILVAYGMIIPHDIINEPKFGFINIHPSLLPKYRGPAPIQSAILNGDAITGVSIIKLTSEVDAGPIIAQTKYSINSAETAESLHNMLAKLGANLLVKILPDYLNQKIQPKEQDNSLATYSTMIYRKDGQIDWLKSGIQIERQFRAFYPWPGIFCHIEGKRLKIVKLSVLEGNFKSGLTPGEIFLTQNQDLAVQCGDGSLLLEKVQIEGKKEVLGRDFILGRKDLIGKILN